MSALAEVYARFHRSVLTGDASDVLAEIAPHPRLSGAQQWAIYHDGYRTRLLGALRESYEATRALTGEAAFDALAAVYIEQVPPVHFNLDRYGFGFADFIAEGVEPFIHELARLEATIAEIFWSEEVAALDAAHFAALGPEEFSRVVVALRPTAQLLAVRYPVEAWLRAFREGTVGRVPAPSAQAWLVYRHAAQVQRREVTGAEYALLVRLAEGVPVGAAIEQTIGQHAVDAQEIGGQLQAWFSRWLSDGIFCTYK